MLRITTMGLSRYKAASLTLRYNKDKQNLCTMEEEDAIPPTYYRHMETDNAVKHVALVEPDTTQRLELSIIADSCARRTIYASKLAIVPTNAGTCLTLHRMDHSTQTIDINGTDCASVTIS